MTLQANRRRVLIVSYTFPPVGGAGVQRVTKFVKYLRSYGWQPTVLTVANPSVPVFDQSLLHDVPADVVVHGAKSWEPGYALKAQASNGEASAGRSPGGVKRRVVRLAGRFAAMLLQPDPQILWYPNAVSVGKQLVRQTTFDAVFATAPPFSTFLIGRALARHARIPLVVDYRDEWTLSNKYLENKRLGFVASRVQARMERSVLRAAAAVIATTRSSAESLRVHCRSAKSSAAVDWIYNGFDPDDFAGCEPAKRDTSRFRLVYTGTLWNLTSVAPLVEAVRHLASEQPEVASRLEVVFVGRRTGAQVEYVESLRTLPCSVVTHDYLDHTAALSLMCGADACCLLLSDLPGAERVVPAKLFEYVASKRPILALLPKGESWELLADCPNAKCVLPHDTKNIVKWLSSAISGDITGAATSPQDHEPRFDREFQAGQLAKILNSCCEHSIAR